MLDAPHVVVMPGMTAEIDSLAEGLNPDAAFRRAHGIPPKGPGPHADSEYGFPLPSADHPDAKAYARAVLSRAHQSSNFDPADVAKQVAKARRILGVNPTKESSAPLDRAFVALREVSAGPQKGTATVIVIVEGQGSSGYYPASTLVQMVNDGLVEGAQCFTDHPTPTEDVEIPGRSVRRLAGWFSDAKLIDYVDPERGAGKAIEAVFHPQIGREDILGMLQTCVEYAKRFPTKSYVALSINATGEGHDAPSPRDGTPTNLIDQITEVISIDLVTRAGAGGKPIAFRESYIMATKIKREALKAAISADMRAVVKARLSEAAVQLSPQQDQAMDSALGVVDGGPLDRLLDQITGVGAGNDDDDEETDDVTDAEQKAKEAKEKEEREAREAQEREAAGEDMTEADAAPFADMSKDDLVKAHVALKKKMEKREADEATERERKEAKEREAREAAQRAAATDAEKLREAHRIIKEGAVEKVLSAQNVPANFRPRLTHELMRESDITTEAQIIAFVTDWSQAYITPQADGHGGTFRETRGAGAGRKLEISFAATSAYD